MASIGCSFLATDTAVIVDARGLKCPLPVLKMEKQLGADTEVSRLVVLATDPMARIDIPLYCRQNGYDCAVEEIDGVMQFSISRNG